MCVISSQPDHTLHEVELLLEVVEVLQSTSVPLVQLGHQLSLKAGSLKLNLSLYQDASMNNQQLCNETTSHSCLPC